MQSTLLSFSLAISFFMACYALADDDNLQLLTEPASFLSPSSYSSSSPDDSRPPDPSLDYQKSFPNLIDNNNSNDGGNLPPTAFDHQTWITPSVGDVSLVEAHAASASASASGAEDPDTQILWGGDGSGGGGAAGCHMNEKVKRGEEEDQTKNVPALLMCPLLPGQKTAPAPSPTPPADGAAAAATAEEEKKKKKGPVRIDDDTKNREMIGGPPLSSVENKFEWNEEICPTDIYGALRLVPVCHSGNELLERFDSKLGSWTLLDIRPCKFFKFLFFFSEKNKSSSWGNMVL